MTDKQLKADPSPGTWRFDNLKRWEISVILQTVSSLHIGDGNTITRTVRESRTKPREVEVNSIITGKDDRPIIPGSTLKGRLRDYLATNGYTEELVKTVFGRGKDQEDEHNPLGSGGLAEFHDGRWMLSPHEGQENFPYWHDKRKTYVEVSTAINRHSGSALDGSLHYTECVPPGTQFEIIVTGSMEDSHAALIIAALKALGADDRRICLGAGDANGQGHVIQCGEIKVKLLDKTDILGWLKNDSDQQMASSYFRPLGRDEIDELVKNNPCLNEKKGTDPRDIFEITLQLDGPFLVNDPSKTGEDNGETNFYPLLDKDEKPRLPVRSFRGAFRAQAERIIRTLGGECCDTGTTGRCGTGEKRCLCDSLPQSTHLKTERCGTGKKRCLACELFGGTSWKTTLAIDTFTYCNDEIRPLVPQDFVAIDRFHGGAKDGAKFCASYSYAPKFKSKITIDSRIPKEERSWRRGLLALLFRDLKEGDIYLGFGMNKGYGAIETAEISISDGSLFPDEEDLKAFYDRCKQAQHDYPCDEVKESQANVAKPTLPPVTPPLTTDPAKFHNPYHFIPIKKPDTSTWYTKEKLASKESPHSHGFYRSETKDGKKLYHGRIICKLTSETPFFIGGFDDSKREQVAGEAKIKQPYLLNEEIAIPATTLRGLISSLAEAASNSAMRVLEGGIISYRKDADKALKKIGMVFKDGGKWNLVPMIASVPNHKQKLKNYYTACSPISNITTEVNSWSPHHNVVYYVSPNSKGVKDLYTCYSPDRQCGILRILGHKNDDTRIKELEMKKHEIFIPIENKYVDIVDNTFDYKSYCREKGSFPVSDESGIKRYIELADQRTKTQKNNKDLKDDEDCLSSGWLPFHLKGNTRVRDEKMCKLPVHEYGLLYYDDTQGVITEISYSSIWRDRIKDTTEMFFPSDILPFNKKRTSISPAELLFGFTELNEKNENQKHGLGFKGKVRISAGVLSSESKEKDKSKLLGEEIKLKALSAPKPPCPALYFKKNQGDENCYIKKSDLNRNSHETQGRKVYLHAAIDEAGSRKVKKITKNGVFATPNNGALPWASLNDDKDHLKVKICPIQEDNSFYFHLDFNNLTKWEIGLLCYVLRPDENFRHKIGMGKPLGLGSVRIDIGAIQTIDRKKRYLESMQDDSRYNGVGWMDKSFVAEIAEFEAYSPLSAPAGKLSPAQVQEHIYCYHGCRYL